MLWRDINNEFLPFLKAQFGRGKAEFNSSRTLPGSAGKTHLPLFCVLYHWAIWLKQISRTKNKVAFLWGDKTSEKNQGWVNVPWLLRGENTFCRIRREFLPINYFLKQLLSFSSSSGSVIRVPSQDKWPGTWKSFRSVYGPFCLHWVWKFHKRIFTVIGKSLGKNLSKLGHTGRRMWLAAINFSLCKPQKGINICM